MSLPPASAELAPPEPPPEPPPVAVDPRVWKACAGDAAGFPAVGSFVFYFPQGHAEQASSPVDLSPFTHPLVYRCLVTAVDLLSDPETDEVFSRIYLAPVNPGAAPSSELLSRFRVDSVHDVSGDGDGDGESFMSFGKVLTQSDAHNGGGFSVPKFCADTLFPPLDYQANPPAQKLSMRDVQGNVWEFRHIYRGKPPRHLLTTGWSNFVNAKSLVAGDTVMFMRSSGDDLFIGIRRKPSKGFPNNRRGRIPTSSVVDAVSAAKMNMPFEVLYYPGVGSPEFVVSEGLVNVAMGIQWNVGMRIRITIPNQVTGPQGTVKAVNPLFLSPWRMLQVSWDEEEALKDVKSVSPWQVEPVSAALHEQTPLQVMKRPKVQQRQCLDDKESNVLSEVKGLEITSVGDVSPNCRRFPVGMQGARHDSSFVSSFPNLTSINTRLMSSDDLYVIKTPQNNDVRTIVNNGNNLQSRDSSLCSQESIQDMNIEVYKPIPCHPIKAASREYFKLFGHVIQIEPPVDNNANEMQGSKDGHILRVNQHVDYGTNEKRGSKDDHIDPITNDADGYGRSENDQINQTENFDPIVEPS